MPSAKSVAKKTETNTTPASKKQEPPKKETKETKETKPSKDQKSTTPAKQTKTKEVKSVEPVVDTPVSVENVVVTTDSINDNFSSFITKFQALMVQFTGLRTELRTLEKKTLKEIKVIQKQSNKKKRKGTRAPSGFVKPAPISNELAGFLGLPVGSEMARTDVTREINKYIRQEQLQDASNGRKINPDVKLRKLLEVPESEDLTYFNLQKYLSKHFPKPVVVASSE